MIKEETIEHLSKIISKRKIIVMKKQIFWREKVGQSMKQ